MTTLNRDGLVWRKSERSGATGNCVEVALNQKEVAVRDSKNPSGTVLWFAAEQWRRFVAGVIAGEFDLP